jgi:hypothetical protein
MARSRNDSQIFATVIKLLVASFVVGLVLSFLDIDPFRLFHHFWETVSAVVERVVSFADWSVRYVALGAIVVVPLWLIPTVLRWIGRHRNASDPPTPAADGSENTKK